MGTDAAAAYLRTYWPVVMGTLTGLIVTALAHYLGLTINSDLVLAVVTALSIAAVYAAGRWLEKRPSPIAQAAGRWLLSFGRDVGQPTYTPTPPAPTAAAGAHRQEQP